MGVIHSNGLLPEYQEILLHVQNAGHVVCACVHGCVCACVSRVSWVGQEPQRPNKATQKRLGSVIFSDESKRLIQSVRY